MNSDQISSLVRALMQIGGTALAAHGVILPDAQCQSIVGGVIAIVGVVWSQVFHAKNGA